MKPNTKWTPDRVSAIRDLAASGCSGNEIAACFNVTRNTIIGVCWRNKIPLGGANPDPKRRAACAGAVQRIASKRKEVRTRITAPVPKVAPVVPPPASGIALEALTKTTCRWPLLDRAPQLFCGGHTDDGRYCQHHAAKAVSANQGGRL